MLSSAKKSVPTLKQCIQPYFIEIAPDGAIMASCTRTLDTPFDSSSLSRTTNPRSLDLSVNRPGSRSFLIRWTPTPANEPVEGAWQFQIMQWNKTAEKCYGISARHAVGRNFRELISYEYVNSTQEEAERLFNERGYWDGETVYISPNGKKSYLLCSVRTIRDSREKIIGIVAIAIDNTSDAISITDINFKVIYQNPSHQRIFRRTARRWNSESGILNCMRQPSLARELVAELNLFGGKVTIMSAPGEGCKLRVQVPVL